MSAAAKGKQFLAYIKDLGSNVYFWGGLVALLLVGALVYLSIDRIVMPDYTRYGTAVEVPDVRDQPVEQARLMLREQGLYVEEQEGQYNPNVPQDVVVDQSPAPHTSVKPDRRIYLTLNRGELPTMVLPDFTDISRREARNRAEGRGLVVDSMRADSIPSPHENTITRQSPAPGDTVTLGSSITFWYSTGLGTEETTVPDLVGLTVAEARSALLNEKLRPLIVRDRVEGEDDELGEDELYVRAQSQAPEARVQTGSEVRLYVVSDPDNISRPDGNGSDNGSSSPTMEANSESFFE